MSDRTGDLQDVVAYYAQGLESGRLDRGPGALELARTQVILERILPSPPARIADIGGGPGRYALWLADRGYHVHLIDPVQAHIQEARAASCDAGVEQLVMADTGDARELALPDASVDVVLLLGPLYHLTSRADRVRALAEARRICRAGGVMVAAAISRFAVDARWPPRRISGGSGLRRSRRGRPRDGPASQSDARSGVLHDGVFPPA